MNKDLVGRIIVGTGKTILYGLSCLTLFVPYIENGVNAAKRLTVDASYSGAIKAIMESNTLDSCKKNIIDVLLKNQSEEYYKSVIEVVNSDMLDSYKVETIIKITTN